MFVILKECAYVFVIHEIVGDCGDCPQLDNQLSQAIFTTVFSPLPPPRSVAADSGEFSSQLWISVRSWRLCRTLRCIEIIDQFVELMSQASSAVLICVEILVYICHLLVAWGPLLVACGSLMVAWGSLLITWSSLTCFNSDFYQVMGWQASRDVNLDHFANPYARSMDFFTVGELLMGLTMGCYHWPPVLCPCSRLAALHGAPRAQQLSSPVTVVLVCVCCAVMASFDLLPEYVTLCCSLCVSSVRPAYTGVLLPQCRSRLPRSAS